MKQNLPDFTLTGVHAAGLQTRAVTECLNCTKPYCDFCPKPREENDKNRRRNHGQISVVPRNLGKLQHRN